MTVVGGRFKGRKLFFVQNKNVRPMTQKVREAIYDFLQNRIDGASMLDLFCGSGAVGIEGLSRGVRSVDFVDIRTDVVSRNVTQLGVKDMVNIYRTDAVKALAAIHRRNKVYDYIFVGAPYDYVQTERILRRIDEHRILREGGILLLEQRTTEDVPSGFTTFRLERKYTYGQTMILRYEHLGTVDL